ncbi:MAG TPA: Ig-like domain-containing protein [Oligoflexia bacterium]|nr:Ig-like domain-containing protein [Oligoflexia bacterium]HMR24821.1 Ig-like domain-containing protein [Oligoflexia bacterium]
MKPNKNFPYAIFLFLILFILNCARDDSVDTPLPDTEFYVVDLTPGFQTTTSSGFGKKIVVVFSMPVDPYTLLTSGNFSFIEDINGVPQNLTHTLLPDPQSSFEVVTFNINYPLSNRADYTFNISNAVKDLSLSYNLRYPVSHQFNTGGGFTQGDYGTTVPGNPYIVDTDYIRVCETLANGTQEDKAYIDVRFNEALAFPPLIDIQRVDLSSQWTINNRPMIQKTPGDPTLMTVEVDSIGGLNGYRIRFNNNTVQDLQGLGMDDFTSSGMYQAFGGC